MGVDINAVLYFGFPFLWDEDYEMDEKLHERLSAMVDEDDDSVPYPVCGKKDGKVNLGKSGDFYNGNTVSYVYIIGTKKEAGRWEHADLSPADMMTYDLPKWRQALQEFCTVNGIPWEEPGWKMTARHS
jgi:hypothetical protein